MLTKAEIKKLPKGDYPNHMLVRMFPKNQGHGKSARIKTVKVEGKHGRKESFMEMLINQFTGKPAQEKKKNKK